ncbi:MAG: hypothetical protein FWD40_06110 [Treponema sp.]|nr:hypothetical protein [Treponema sp.]
MKGIGQNFNDFLKEQDIYEEVNELAAKKQITYQLKQAMKEKKLTISLS